MKKIMGPVMAALLCLGFLGHGCKGEEETVSGNKPPRIVFLEINPKSPAPGEQLHSSLEVTDPEADSVRMEYEWYVDGKLVAGADKDVFPTDTLQPGAKIRLKARAVEEESGRAGDWRQSNLVTVGDFPALMLAGVSLEPGRIYANTTVRAVADYGSLDQYEVDTVYYRWFVNQKPLDDYSGPELDPGAFKRGDNIQVQACTDGLFEGDRTVKSNIVGVWNSLPEWTERPSIEMSGSIANFSYGAEDPDGDKVNIKVQGGPPGLKAAGPGLLTVDLSNVRPGPYTITFTADDGNGGRISSTIKLTVPE